jgi:hypothetical protein
MQSPGGTGDLCQDFRRNRWTRQPPILNVLDPDTKGALQRLLGEMA